MTKHIHCIPCRKGDQGLAPEAIRNALDQLSGWELTEDGTAIRKSWKFKNFKDALAFVNRAGAVAEAQNHHPDIAFGWGYAHLTFTTHAIGGLHENDVIMARLVDAI